MTETAPLEFDALVASEKGIAEMQDGRPVVFVPRAEIRQLELARASSAERPALTAAVGAILLAAGGYLFLPIVDWMLHGGQIRASTGLLAGGLVLMGGWLLYFALRKRLVLIVRTTNENRKLLISNQAPLEEAESFARAVAERFRCDLRLAARDSG